MTNEMLVRVAHSRLAKQEGGPDSGTTTVLPMSETAKGRFDYFVGRASWEATRERLGIDDAELTKRLDQAGFPPAQL